MSSTNRASLRAGVLGLMVGCVPALWLAGLAAAAPNPAPPAVTAGTPVFPAPGAGGGQLGQIRQIGSQFDTTAVTSADEELRMHFPLESVTDRLDYERAALKRQADDGTSARMTAQTQESLAALEKRFKSRTPTARMLRLLQLHTDRVLRFGNSPGNGLGRIGTPQFNGLVVGPQASDGLTPEELELPGVALIPFASERASADDDAPAADTPPPKRDRLAALHVNALFDFLDPAGFGYVRDREHVAGFEPHQFRHMPEAPTERGAGRTEKWAVVRLQLVSLLKHDRPVVYSSNVLPSMIEANRPETRPLTAFEEKALKALREGDDLVTESSGDRIRMMGSLRAAKQCLECHDAKRGDLLGAFSWDLQRQTVGKP